MTSSRRPDSSPSLQAQVDILGQQLQAVRDIGAALSQGVGLDALFSLLVPHLTRLMNAERSTLFLYDAKSGQIWSKVAEGEGGREIRLELGQGVAGCVARDRQTVSIDNAYDDPRFNRSVDAQTGFRTRNIAAAPLLDHEGTLLGVLQVLNRHGEEGFTQQDLATLSAIAVQTSYAVENARLSQRLIDQNKELEAARHRAERRRAELDLLYQLEQETNESADLDNLLDSVIVRACERLRSTAGSVLLVDRDSGRLFFRGVTGEHQDELRRMSLPAGEGVVGWVAKTGQPLVVNRPRDDERHDVSIGERIEVPAEALLAVPLTWNDEVIGAVEVLNPQPRPTGAVGYDEEDLKVLTLIAGQVARAVALTRERQARIDTERLAFLGRMLAGVAHDLRNPMTVISGYAQLMALEDHPDQREQRCERILHQIDEMTAMVGDLLAFARGDTRLKTEDLSLAQLARELIESQRLHCDPRGIEFDVLFDDLSVVVDPQRVKRIIGNLAKNSIDVLRRGERLTIELRARDGHLCIDVCDTGSGIPEEVKATLFEPFVTAGKEHGTGLGLSIVKKFVEDHGGEISAKSSPEHGTVFSVRLPVVPPSLEVHL